MRRNVWMNGNTLYGTVASESDRQLRKDIVETTQDNLENIESLNFVNYE